MHAEDENDIEKLISQVSSLSEFDRIDIVVLSQIKIHIFSFYTKKL